MTTFCSEIIKISYKESEYFKIVNIHKKKMMSLQQVFTNGSKQILTIAKLLNQIIE